MLWFRLERRHGGEQIFGGFGGARGMLLLFGGGGLAALGAEGAEGGGDGGAAGAGAGGVREGGDGGGGGVVVCAAGGGELGVMGAEGFEAGGFGFEEAGGGLARGLEGVGGVAHGLGEELGLAGFDAGAARPCAEPAAVSVGDVEEGGVVGVEVAEQWSAEAGEEAASVFRGGRGEDEFLAVARERDFAGVIDLGFGDGSGGMGQEGNDGVRRTMRPLAVAGGHELDGAFDGAFLAAAERDAAGGGAERGLRLPLAGCGVVPFEDFGEAFEVVVVAEILLQAEAGEVFAGLGGSEERVLFPAAEVFGERVSKLPHLYGFIATRFEVGGPDVPAVSGLAGDIRGLGMEKPVVGFVAGFAAGIAFFLFGVAGGRVGSDHGSEVELDPAGEHFGEGGSVAGVEGGGAAFEGPMRRVRGERVAFENPGGELFHVSNADAGFGAVGADSARVHHVAKDEAGGVVAGDEEPELAGLAGGGVKDEPVHAHVVNGDVFQKVQAVAGGELVGEAFEGGGGALLDEGGGGGGEPGAFFDLAEEIRVGEAARDEGGVAGGPEGFVAGDGLGFSVVVEAGAPLAVEGEDGLAFGVTAFEGGDALLDIFEGRFGEAVGAGFPGGAGAGAVDQGDPVAGFLVEIVAGAELFGAAGEGVGEVAPGFGAGLSDA